MVFQPKKAVCLCAYVCVRVRVYVCVYVKAEDRAYGHDTRREVTDGLPADRVEEAQYFVHIREFHVLGQSESNLHAHTSKENCA